jgi:hypothetical protein
MNIEITDNKYRCTNGSDTTVGTMHDTKKHYANTMASRVWAAISTRSVSTNTTRKVMVHLNTKATHLYTQTTQ